MVLIMIMNVINHYGYHYLNNLQIIIFHYKI